MDERLVELERYGLTSLQSRVYVALLKLGPIRAPKLSGMIGIARPEAYRVLRELSAKGLVQRLAVTPSTYTPVTPDRAVNILLERYSRRLHELEAGKTTLVKSLSALESPRESDFDERFTIITGGQNLDSRARQMATNAKSDYAAVISKFGLRRSMTNGFAQNLVAAKKRKGLNIRIISEIDETNTKPANYLSRYCELRVCHNIQYYLDIIDKTSVFLGPYHTDDEVSEWNKREIDLFTSNIRFVNGMYSMFEQLWEASPRYVP